MCGRVMGSVVTLIVLSAVTALATPAGAVPPSRSTSLRISPAGRPAMTGSDCGSGSTSAGTDRSGHDLTKLSAGAQQGLARYGREVGSRASVLDWYDSGGAAGGGVPVAAVRSLMRAGLARGLTDDQVSAFLSPRLLRGISDPYGSGGVIAFVVERGDRALFEGLSGYAAESGPAPQSSTEAQRALFASFPELVVAYLSLAGAPPIDEAGAVEMAGLANDGYRPAQRTIDLILAAGNRPSAGAQGSGSVADGVRPDVYDAFVRSYLGPLSAEGQVARANRLTYLDWVDRIAIWASGGSSVEAVPLPPTFIGIDEIDGTSTGVVPSMVGSC